MRFEPRNTRDWGWKWIFKGGCTTAKTRQTISKIFFCHIWTGQFHVRMITDHLSYFSAKKLFYSTFTQRKMTLSIEYVLSAHIKEVELHILGDLYKMKRNNGISLKNPHCGDSVIHHILSNNILLAWAEFWLKFTNWLQLHCENTKTGPSYLSKNEKYLV